MDEVGPARAGGRERSKNVGMSSKNGSENLPHRKPKVSWATKIDPGLVGPKARPNGVVDGHPVNIPELRRMRYHDGETREDRRVG